MSVFAADKLPKLRREDIFCGEYLDKFVKMVYHIYELAMTNSMRADPEEEI